MIATKKHLKKIPNAKQPNAKATNKRATRLPQMSRLKRLIEKMINARPMVKTPDESNRILKYGSRFSGSIASK